MYYQARALRIRSDYATVERTAAVSFLGQLLDAHTKMDRMDPRVLSRDEVESRGVPLKRRKLSLQKHKPNAHAHWLQQEYATKGKMGRSEYLAWVSEASKRWHSKPAIEKATAAAQARLKMQVRQDTEQFTKLREDIVRPPLLETMLSHCGDNTQPLRADVYERAVMDSLGSLMSC